MATSRTTPVVQKYQVIVKEYQTFTEYLNPGEPGASTQQDREVWVETDVITSRDPKVIAGLLRAKAEQLDPKPKTIFRGSDA